MDKRNFRLLDENNREVFQLPLARAKKDVAPFEFIMIVQQALEYLSKIGLTGDQWAVLSFALSRLDMNDEIFWDHPLCFAATGIRRENQLKALKNLVDRGVLIRNRKYGNAWIYKPNELLCWRGSLNNWWNDLQEMGADRANLHAKNVCVLPISRGEE